MFKPFRTLFIAALSAFFMCGAAFSETPTDPCAGVEIEKVERPGVWRPGLGGKQIPIWPALAKIEPPETGGKSEWMGNGSPLVAGRTWNWATYVSNPTMTIYMPKTKKTDAAMLVLPGGGFAAVAMDLEGTEVCDWVTREGMTCIILKYRVPQTWPRDKNGIGQPPEKLLALEDAQRALSLLRQNATAHKIDPEKIGVIGFSAGAYVAAAVSNEEARTYAPLDKADKQSFRPAFAILLYPGRLWDKSRPDALELAPWVKISAKAPPTLLIHAMTDPGNDVRHSMAYGLALKNAGVAVDMRLYGKGCHAFGLRPTADPITTEWPNEAADWLRDSGLF